MRILLISPNTLSSPYPVYPIGLDYVAGAVVERHQVRIADMNTLSRTDLDQVIHSFSPQIIGLSLRNIDTTDASTPLAFVESYRELVTWLRSRSSAIIVCGGSAFSIMPEAILNAVDADYGLIGEGERFGPFVDALEAEKDITGLPGILSHGQKCTPVPPRQNSGKRTFGKAFQHHHFYLKNGGMLNLQSKRGCSFSCLYCPYPHIEGKQHRLIEPEVIARTALELQEAGAKYLYITDSAFNSDINHSLDVARAFRRIGLRIPWGGFFSPTRLPASYFTEMRQAGLRHVEFGSESLSESMLRSYCKPYNPEDIREAHRLARDAGLHVAHYLLMGGPGESEATVTTTLDQIEELDKAVFFIFVGMRIYPNTPLYDLALAEGKITPETNLLKPFFYAADAIDHQQIETMVHRRAGNRINWVIGSGDDAMAETVKKMHGRDFSGPLWEYLAR